GAVLHMLCFDFRSTDLCKHIEDHQSACRGEPGESNCVSNSAASGDIFDKSSGKCFANSRTSARRPSLFSIVH
ncbi:hypothetical protein M513_14000, partial [Trichuris suis]